MNSLRTGRLGKLVRQGDVAVAAVVWAGVVQGLVFVG